METFLTALRAARADHLKDAEAEGVIVRTEGDDTIVTLDDGQVVAFDRAELHAATAPQLSAAA
jgi:2-C-methyl-D-erythritol 4-phosphate cytidylyltransferase